MGTADELSWHSHSFFVLKCSLVKLDSSNVDVLYSLFFLHHV